MKPIDVKCPRCNAEPGQRCHHPSAGWGPDHVERRNLGVLVLFSGGMDSTLLVKRALAAGRWVVPLFVDYGQPHHDEELAAAEAFSATNGLHLRTVERGLHGGLVKGGSPVVPHRNLALLAYAANRAVAEGVTEVQIGCCHNDARTFRDCRTEYIERAAYLLAQGGVKLTAPLLYTTKREIRRELGRQLGSTWSCYHPTNGEPCGKCGACRAREGVSQ